uniref:Uncharacterized protein n=1 Tax=uncultured marine thaumarchaeote KM3_63_D09 TaxID=1456219 RepID=A0A075HEP7_9ARCH|nr:hypothetical protein [uncultured marine thaumarchaeote KM3_63_D09]
MKNYLVIASMVIILLVPLNANALTVETLQQWLLEAAVSEMVKIKDKNQPYASAYTTIRNSNGDLVGVSHTTASQHLEHPLFYAFINDRDVSENVTFKGTQYQMLDLMPTKEYFDADCNGNAFQQKMGYGIINDVCFFNSFASELHGKWSIADLEDMVVDDYTISMFRGLQSGFIVEEGDTLNLTWAVLIPIN